MGADSKHLNEHQQRRLLITCRHIDALLADMETTLNAAASKSPFPRYIGDVPPSEGRMIEDHIAHMRAQLVRVLEGQEIEVPAPSIPASRSIYTALTFIEIDVEELKPKYMRGYGEIPASVAGELDGIVRELESSVQRLNEVLVQILGASIRDWELEKGLTEH